MMQEERPWPKRESIWSIDSKWLTVYFALFTILSTINVARVIWYHATQVAHENWSLATDAMMHGIGVNVFGSAGASITITELGRFTMVLGGLLQDAIDRRREKQAAAARAEGRSEGRAEGVVEGIAVGRAQERAEVLADVDERIRQLNDRLLRDWKARRLRAEENDEPFDEPRPEPIDLGLTDRSSNGAEPDDAPGGPGRNGA